MMPLVAAEPVSFTTADGIIIKGLYHASRQPRKPVVIMLHGMGSTKEEWTPFERTLVDAGFSYFAYDARGHGESTTTTTGAKINYKNFGAPGPGSPWQAMIDDLDYAAVYLSHTKHIPESSLIIVGASIGANIALVWAAQHPSVNTVLLLSPGLDYAGIETSTPVAQFQSRRIAFVASPNDPYAYQSSRQLFNRLSSNPSAVFFTGAGGHGVQMFNGTFEKDLVRWLSK